MRNLVLVLAVALAVLLVPVTHAQGWALSGPPKYTADPTAPGGGVNPATNGGTNTQSDTSISLSSQSTAVSSPNSYVHNTASIYGKYKQNFYWQGMGPPNTQFTLEATFGVDGDITAMGYDRASSYSAPGLGGPSGDTGAPGAKIYYHIASGTWPVVKSDPPGSFTASLTASFGALSDAGNPPNGSIQPTQNSSADANGSYTVTSP